MSVICPVCSADIPDAELTCSSCGYHRIDATQRFEPIGSLDSNQSSDKQEMKTAYLKVIRGPQIDAVFTLGTQPLSVGRNPNCDIFLNDMTVSRDHALIKPLAGGYVVSDKNSFNGVWINNVSISERVLKPGDIVQLGVFCLQYEEE